MNISTPVAEAIARVLTVQSHNDPYYLQELIDQAEKEVPGWTFHRITVDARFGEVIATPRTTAPPAGTVADGLQRKQREEKA